MLEYSLIEVMTHSLKHHFQTVIHSQPKFRYVIGKVA